jgi:hypothetical protein
MKKIFVVLFVMALSITSSVYADTVSGNFTTDNHFKMWISTDDTVAGSQQYTSDWTYWDWTSPEAVSFTLTPGVTNYLHVYAWDDGQTAAGVIGNFSLNSASYWFDNGTQSLLTNADEYWKVRENGFNGTDITSYLIDEGGVGAAPWAGNGDLSSINANARWMWTDKYTFDGIYGHDLGKERYFSAAINTVPEPVSTALFLLGGATLAVRRMRKNKR